MTAAPVSTGSVPHLLTELLESAAGIDVLEVPYKGGSPAATDVMGGQVDMFFSVLPLVLPHINSGKLPPIAVASEKRSVLIPDVPTMREVGYPQVSGSAWNGIVAPAGVPQEIVFKLNAEIAKVLDSPDTRDHFTAMGMEAGSGICRAVRSLVSVMPAMLWAYPWVHRATRVALDLIEGRSVAGESSRGPRSNLRGASTCVKSEIQVHIKNLGLIFSFCSRGAL